MTGCSVLTLRAGGAGLHLRPAPSAQRRAPSFALRDSCAIVVHLSHGVTQMPTFNPRVNVTLSPSLFDLVGRLATLQGASRSQVLRELLEAAEPALQRAVALMQAAERSKGAVREGLGDSLMRAQDRIEAELGKHLDLVDSTTHDLVEMAERIEGRRPGRTRESGGARGGAGAPNPPASNRGVKSPERATTPPQSSHRGSPLKGVKP